MQKIIKHLKSPIKKTLKISKNITYEITKLPKHFISSPLDAFRNNYYSQNGEDGVVEELFRQLNITDGWAVEFGAWDGIYLSNTFRIIEKNKNFKAVYIEGDKERFKDLVQTSEKFPNRIIPIEAFVQPTGEASLDNLLKNTPLPKNFEILSIDVDSIDYQIWEGFNNYKPKIVIIEISTSIPFGKLQTHDIEKGLQGSSFSSMLNLGKSKGYTLVCHIGNMIFVENSLIQRIKNKELNLSTPEKLFKYKEKK